MKKGLFIGALIGGAATYLATSKKGKEIQAYAKKEFMELKENYPEKIEELKEKGKEILDVALQKVKEQTEKEEPKIYIDPKKKDEE